VQRVADRRVEAALHDHGNDLAFARRRCGRRVVGPFAGECLLREFGHLRPEVATVLQDRLDRP
jgi:hypothetical protein